jgi:hypothetical protein
MKESYWTFRTRFVLDQDRGCLTQFYPENLPLYHNVAPEL